MHIYIILIFRWALEVSVGSRSVVYSLYCNWLVNASWSLDELFIVWVWYQLDGCGYDENVIDSGMGIGGYFYIEMAMAIVRRLLVSLIV